MARRVVRRSSEDPRSGDQSSDHDLEEAVRQYASIQRQEQLLSEKKAELRDTLVKAVQAEGFEDDNKHLLREMSVPVEAVSKKGDLRSIYAVKYQRRVSRSLDQERAEKILSKAGIRDECIVMVPRLDEDAIMAALYEDKLTDDQVDDMYKENVTYALVLEE